MWIIEGTFGRQKMRGKGGKVFSNAKYSFSKIKPRDLTKDHVVGRLVKRKVDYLTFTFFKSALNSFNS